jgi:nucleotide-binding universal stress UspA family protein
MIAIQRILMATDFSNYSKEALSYAVYLAKLLKADLYLIHVFETPFYSHTGVSASVQRGVQDWIQELKKEELKKLETLAEETQKQGVKVHAVFKDGKAFVEIIKAIEEVHADLIVIGTHGRTGLPHVVMGSVAERVVRQSPCPVFTTRPKASVSKENKG